MKINRYLSAILLSMAVMLMCNMAFAQQAPGTVILKAVNGGVKFDHTAHMKTGKCTDCHHASKAEKPLASAHEKCSDCHTKAATAPVTTKLQGAFHNPTATAGTCIDCHKTKGQGPVKCADCHKKENV